MGLVGLLGSLVPLLIIGGGSPNALTDGVAPINRLEREAVDIGAVEGKPQFPTPPSLTIDPASSYEAVLELEGGTVRLQMFADLAPVHVNNFVFLANLGFYDGITFYRVIPGFVAQGGDPTATGTGGAGYTLQDEDVAGNADALTPGRHRRDRHGPQRLGRILVAVLYHPGPAGGPGRTGLHGLRPRGAGHGPDSDAPAAGSQRGCGCPRGRPPCAPAGLRKRR